MKNLETLTCKYCGSRKLIKKDDKFICEYCGGEFFIKDAEKKIQEDVNKSKIQSIKSNNKNKVTFALVFVLFACLFAGVVYFFYANRLTSTLPENKKHLSSPVKNYILGHSYDEIITNMNGNWTKHMAVDFLTVGTEPVYSVASGEVYAVGGSYELGQFIQIWYEDNILITYASIENIQYEFGDKVNKNSIIAYTSYDSLEESWMGYHLHFQMEREISENCFEWVNPLEYLEVL